MVEIVSNGKQKMPAQKGKLSADQLKQLVTYVKQLGKTPRK
jgi:mono/diheme cytochrome c family protein